VPEETSLQSPDTAHATDEYLKQTIVANNPPAVMPEAAPENPPVESEEPPELLAGKFKTQEDLVDGYKASCREFNDAKPMIDRASRYDTVLRALEDDQGFREHAAAYYNPSAKAAEAAPLVKTGVDEYGVPTGEVEIDQAQLQQVIATEARKQAMEIAESERQRMSYEQQLAELKTEENLTDEEVRAFVDKANRPNSFSIKKLYRLEKLGETEAAASNRGAKQVVDRIRQTQKKGPAIGVATGQPEEQKSIGEAMADDILRVGVKSDAEVEFGI